MIRTASTKKTDLGELMTLFFQQFMDLYGDEELAAVATAAVINDLLTDDQKKTEQTSATA